MKKALYIFIVLASFAALPVHAGETGPSPAAVTPQTTPAGDKLPAAPLPQVSSPPAPPARSAMGVKIGYVDMPRVAKDSAPGKAATADMKARTAKLRGQVEAKQKQLEKQKADIEAKLPTMTPQQRAAKAKEFQKKLEEFQKFVEKGQKELQGKEAELLGKLFKEIEKSSGDYGKANGFAAVVVKHDILFVGDGVEIVDLTDEIIKMTGSGAVKK
jgi:outer membrane protein